jgi:hypothetical protein
VLVAFLIGGLIVYIPLRVKLDRCEADKTRLTADLKRAVIRGLATEAQLNLCKGENK